jgi:hypothetical protein
VKTDPHSRVLDAYFWHFVDCGDAPQATPLFTGIHEGEELAAVIARQFDVALHEAKSVIEIARSEVAL